MPRPKGSITRKIDNPYIPLFDDEELEWEWEEKLVLKVDQMWAEGHSVYRIAEELKKHPDEVLILLIDRARKGYINKRPGGVFGVGELPRRKRG
jgi:uracil phosphoribosyltransferase